MDAVFQGYGVITINAVTSIELYSTQNPGSCEVHGPNGRGKVLVITLEYPSRSLDMRL